MRAFLILLLIIGLGYFIYKSIFKLKEGVTFTNYDNYHTFNTKPWDAFCIPNSPSCENNPMYSPKTNGITLPGAAEPGCHCKKSGVSTLTRSCTYIDYNPYVEYRR